MPLFYCSSPPPGSQIALISVAATAFLLIIAAVGIYCFCWKRKRNDREGIQSCNEEIMYAETTFHKRNSLNVKEENHVVYAAVSTRRSQIQHQRSAESDSVKQTYL
ncbi:hypothetical protein Q8A67_006311 [Cirrhinus molitorella]|uniref:Uncharacterized protein n=1 Tax=Cirrhinus molitorella TaxID=172907 RepID=A0AA88Q1V3_9TELE|nr:hypothetical protein Q8A67_006311 [Cirrhinus molitorella]